MKTCKKCGDEFKDNGKNWCYECLSENESRMTYIQEQQAMAEE